MINNYWLMLMCLQLQDVQNTICENPSSGPKIEMEEALTHIYTHAHTESWSPKYSKKGLHFVTGKILDIKGMCFQETELSQNIMRQTRVKAERSSEKGFVVWPQSKSLITLRFSGHWRLRIPNYPQFLVPSLGALSPSGQRIRVELIQGKLLRDETAGSLNVWKTGKRYFGKCWGNKDNISLLTVRWHGTCVWSACVRIKQVWVHKALTAVLNKIPVFWHVELRQLVNIYWRR